MGYVLLALLNMLLGSQGPCSAYDTIYQYAFFFTVRSSAVSSRDNARLSASESVYVVARFLDGTLIWVSTLPLMTCTPKYAVEIFQAQPVWSTLLLCSRHKRGLNW